MSDWKSFASEMLLITSWVLVLHYLWSFSLSVASVWHLIAFSTLPLPLKEENESLHADQSCKSRNGPKLSSNSSCEPLQVTLDEISVPWVHTAWPLFGFGPAPQRHNFRRPVFGCMCVYYIKASRMVSLWHLFTQMDCSVCIIHSEQGPRDCSSIWRRDQGLVE